MSFLSRLASCRCSPRGCPALWSALVLLLCLENSHALFENQTESSSLGSLLQLSASSGPEEHLVGAARTGKLRAGGRWARGAPSASSRGCFMREPGTALGSVGTTRLPGRTRGQGRCCRGRRWLGSPGSAVLPTRLRNITAHNGAEGDRLPVCPKTGGPPTALPSRGRGPAGCRGKCGGARLLPHPCFLSLSRGPGGLTVRKEGCALEVGLRRRGRPRAPGSLWWEHLGGLSSPGAPCILTAGGHRLHVASLPVYATGNQRAAASASAARAGRHGRESPPRPRLLPGARGGPVLGGRAGEERSQPR